MASGDGSSLDFDIVPLGNAQLSEVLEVLQTAFGDGFDERWFSWKHRSGPWGPSEGWVATDDRGLVGVRLFLPWRFATESNHWLARRPCDTVTASRARGRGVFKTLTLHALSNLDPDVDLLFNTPNSQSKPGYLKMGFVPWIDVEQRAHFVIPRRASLVEGATWSRAAELVETDRSKEFLNWRYSQSPMHPYRIMSLSEAHGANGIVVRTASARGVRFLVVAELWGGVGERSALLAAACKELGARVAWVAAESWQSMLSMSRAQTTVTRLDLRDTDIPQAFFSTGDVESVL